MPNSKEKRKEQGKALAVQMIPNINPRLGRIYSNFVQISHSPWDFTLKFCDAPPGADVPRLKKGNILEIPTIVEVIIPVNLMSGLLKALDDQNQKYIKSYVKVEKTNGKNK